MFAPRAPLRNNRGFGRRRPFVHAVPTEATALASSLADDARLFLLNFVGGLIFMTIYLA